MGGPGITLEECIITHTKTLALLTTRRELVKEGGLRESYLLPRKTSGTLGVRVGVGTIPGTGVNSRGCYSGHRLAQPPCYTHHTLLVLQQGPCWQRG